MSKVINEIKLKSAGKKYVFLVEDESYNKIYCNIISKLTGKRSSEIFIYTTGGKMSLIEIFKLYHEIKEKKKIFFIADMDFEIINNYNEKNSNFYFLEKFCIENYLFDKREINHFISLKLKLDYEEVVSNNYYQKYIDTILELFYELHLYFYLNFHKKLGIKSSSENSKKYVQHGKKIKFIPNEKLKEKIDEIKMTFEKKNGKGTSEEEVTKIKKIVEKNLSSKYDFINGKYYFQLINEFIIKEYKNIHGNNCKYKFDELLLIDSCSRNFDEKIFSSLKKKINIYYSL